MCGGLLLFIVGLGVVPAERPPVRRLCSAKTRRNSVWAINNHGLTGRFAVDSGAVFAPIWSSYHARMGKFAYVTKHGSGNAISAPSISLPPFRSSDTTCHIQCRRHDPSGAVTPLLSPITANGAFALCGKFLTLQ